MPTIKNNALLKGAQGNFNKQFVYKTRAGNLHLAKMPTVNKDAPATEAQEEVRDLFAEAAQYARNAVADPFRKQEYERSLEPGKTAFNRAIRDYLKAPVVKKIDTSAYKGLVGDSIFIKAKDDFRVTAVHVVIRDAFGALIEEGDAIIDPNTQRKWKYMATVNNGQPVGSQVTVTAIDMPGNKGSMTETVM